MSSWFASFGKQTRIEIPEIDGWIEVKDELSIGEERQAFTSAVKGQTQNPDGTTRMDYDAEKVSFGLTVAYLTDWSARDAQDKPVLVSADAIKALKPEFYHPIEKAVQAHAEAVRARKKRPRSETSDAAISSSVNG